MSAMRDDGTAPARPRRSAVFFDDHSRYRDRFGLLLAVTVGTIVIMSLVDISVPEDAGIAKLGAAAASALVGATMLLALRASGVARRWRGIADIVVAVTLGALLLTAVFEVIRPGSRVTATTAPYVLVVLSAAAPVLVIHRLLEHRVVTRATLLGAISAYLLIPVAYFYAFITAGIVAGPFFANHEPTTTFMYFSLTCLSTLGFGDVTADKPLGHLLATSEAITGSIYLVTFVAMTVGLYSRGRHDDREHP
jgi:hypothetical protein